MLLSVRRLKQCIYIAKLTRAVNTLTATDRKTQEEYDRFRQTGSRSGNNLDCMQRQVRYFVVYPEYIRVVNRVRNPQ